jgi:hypothetical protein
MQEEVSRVEGPLGAVVEPSVGPASSKVADLTALGIDQMLGVEVNAAYAAVGFGLIAYALVAYSVRRRRLHSVRFGGRDEHE